MVPDGPVHIRRITVKKLFGIYDHRIDLNQVERVTVVHGPNGVGKTVLLKMVAALFAGRLGEVARVPFRQFEVELSNSVVILLQPAGKAGEDPEDAESLAEAQGVLPGLPRPSNGKPGRAARVRSRRAAALELVLSRDGAESRRHDVGLGSAASEELAQYLDATVPWLSRMGRRSWQDTRTGEVLTFADAVERYGRELPPRLRALSPRLPDWFERVRESVNVHLIETQRLIRFPFEDLRGRTAAAHYRAIESEKAVMSTVREHALDLKRRVTEGLARYASEAEALDQSFPQRLLSAPGVDLSVDEIKARIGEIERHRGQLKTLGLLDDARARAPFDVATLDDLDTTQRRVLTLYVEDTAHKLGVLDELARRIELLTNNINAKFKHKNLRFDRESGLVMIGHDDEGLDLEALSSGEQHELVLLYDLLFHVKPDTLVLIDEPELSLHLTWQKRFLPDLLEIVQAVHFDVLIATHSPFIAGARTDLMVALEAEAE